MTRGGRAHPPRADWLAAFGTGGCRGLEAVKRSERVYLEAYTSLLLVPKEKLVRRE